MKGYSAAVILLALFCSACATAEPSPAKARYLAYEKALSDTENDNVYREYLSDRLMSFHENAKSDKELESYRKQGAFPLWLEEEKAFHERSAEDGRCLTVSGTTFDDEPGYMAVLYKEEDGNLRADDIHYEYPKTSEDFPSDAVCPDEITLSFPSAEDEG